MRIGSSLLLIAIGAILRFAVMTQHSHGFNVGTAGIILMIIGAAGLIISVAWMSSRRRTDVIYRGAGRPPVGQTYIEPNDPIDAPY